jgi:hypothetical protein
MKITAITIALMATLASAAPKPQCKPGTYACTTNSTGAPGWKVCNTSSKWVVRIPFPAPISIFQIHPLQHNELT